MMSAKTVGEEAVWLPLLEECAALHAPTNGFPVGALRVSRIYLLYTYLPCMSLLG